MNFRASGWKALFGGAFAATLWLAPAASQAQAGPAPNGWWKL